MFGFKKKSGDVPPDVGQEEKYDEAHDSEESSEDDSSESADKQPKLDGPNIAGGQIVSSQSGRMNSEINNFQMEKLAARVDSVIEWIKQFYERFSYVSESIGEIRTMNMENEKKISLAMKDAEMVIDIVKEVKPERLRMDYQKFDMKIAALAEKIEANKQFMEEVMNEVNELRRKSEVFVGTEGLMKLNEDSKKDLVELQKLASKTKMQADKSKEIFMEINKGFAENQRVLSIVTALDESYSGLKAEIEKLGLEHGKIVRYSDYLDFKKSYGDKMAAFESQISQVESLKANVEELGDLVETSLSVSRRNEEDIGKIGLKIGADDVKKVEDYENQMNDVVGIVEKLTLQLAEVREHLGMDNAEGKISVTKEKLGLKDKPKASNVVKKKVFSKKVTLPTIEEVRVPVKKSFVKKKSNFPKEVSNLSVEEAVNSSLKEVASEEGNIASSSDDEKFVPSVMNNENKISKNKENASSAINLKLPEILGVKLKTPLESKIVSIKESDEVKTDSK